MIDYRTAEAKRERLPDLIRELIGLKVDIIVSTAQPAIEDAKQITKTIPIVMIASFDPVESGGSRQLGASGWQHHREYPRFNASSAVSVWRS